MAPAPWLMFVIMVGLISAFLAIAVVVGGLSRLARGESFWPSDDGAVRPARSNVFKKRLTRSHAVQRRSAHPNAGKSSVQSVQSVQAFTSRSNVQSYAPPMAPDLPATLDELQRLAHTIALYAKRPNKELAILEAWGETKGEGDGYKRASLLFDTAMSDAARQAAKTKLAAPNLREVETA